MVIIVSIKKLCLWANVTEPIRSIGPFGASETISYMADPNASNHPMNLASHLNDPSTLWTNVLTRLAFSENLTRCHLKGFKMYFRISTKVSARRILRHLYLNGLVPSCLLQLPRILIHLNGLAPLWMAWMCLLRLSMKNLDTHSVHSNDWPPEQMRFLRLGFR